MRNACGAMAVFALMGLVACSSSDNSGSGSGTSAGATTGTGTGTSGGGSTTGTSTGPLVVVDSRDNQTYQTVVIGTQTWLATNMNYKTGAGSYCYGSDASNCATYGRLYEFSSAGQACPTGWRLATDSEWMTLETTLGMAQDQLMINGEITARGTTEGTSLKEGGKSGFEAKLGGYGSNGTFSLLSTDGYFWTSTEMGSGANTLAWRRHVDSSTPYLYRFDNPLGSFAISVRCLMDSP